jgi:lysozyme family protein
VSFEYEKDLIYLAVVPYVLNSEGGYSNNIHDLGGPTNRGIAWNYNKEILLAMGVTDVKNLTKEQALQIYYVKYWQASLSNTIPDKRLAYMHFDAAVNQGVGFSLNALKKLSKNPANFEGNGKNEALWLRLLLEYLDIRLKAYNRDRNRKTFLEGWINRLISLIDQDLKMGI